MSFTCAEFTGKADDATKELSMTTFWNAVAKKGNWGKIKEKIVLTPCEPYLPTDNAIYYTVEISKVSDGVYHVEFIEPAG